MRFVLAVLATLQAGGCLTLHDAPGRAAMAAAFRARQLSLAPTQQQQKKCNVAKPSKVDAKPASRVRSLRMMSDTDDMSSTDPNFSGDELSRTWERTGKGKKRWAPGDETGDIQMDKRLLYSNWVLNPMSLHVKEGCSQSAAANLVLGWLKVPYKTVAGEKSLHLSGSGVRRPCRSSSGPSLPLLRMPSFLTTASSSLARCAGARRRRRLGHLRRDHLLRRRSRQAERRDLCSAGDGSC